MKKSMIVGNGNCDLSGVDFKQDRFIMACDGGANALSAVSECPHALIGDFDSVERAVNMEMEMLGVVKHHMNEEVRECTDMKSALDFLAKYDYDQIDLYGALGTRMDHSLANMLMLFVTATYEVLFKPKVESLLTDTNQVDTDLSSSTNDLNVELNIGK